VSILEAAAFALLTSFMIDRQRVVLAAATVLIIAIVAHVPTPSRVLRWIERQRQRLEQERQVMQLRGSP
jgi:hypothetical protein